MKLAMRPVSSEEKTTFLEMAREYFIELNPRFVPAEDWKACYVESIQSNENMSLRWLTVGEELVGFIIFGVEKHRFLPRKAGVIYDLYVLPRYRRQGVAQTCAVQTINELQSLGVSKVQLEVVEGNVEGRAFWERLGFCKVSSRYTLRS